MRRFVSSFFFICLFNDAQIIRRFITVECVAYGCKSVEEARGKKNT